MSTDPGPLVPLLLIASCASVLGCDTSSRPTEDSFYGPPSESPYSAESVRIGTGDGRVLAGTLTLPPTHPAGAVVMITGSGRQDRDEHIRSVGQAYRPFRQIADTLTRRGFATLRLDDPGIGGSDPYPPDATPFTYAEDIGAAIRHLRRRPEIDAGRIVLLGHSEGAVVALMVAAADSAVAGMVLLAAPAYTLERINRFQRGRRFERGGMAPEDIPSELARTSPGATREARENPWRWAVWRYDPLPTARSIRSPVLLVHGADDQRVTPDQSDTLAVAFREGGNRSVTVRTFPGLGHFLVPTTPNHRTDELGTDLLGTIADWVVAEVGSGSAG